MEQLINIIDNNYKYAPGLPTYGLPGLAGEDGSNGNNIYYTNVLFSETVNGTEDFSVYEANLGIIIDLMEKGQYPRTDQVLVLNRKITDGDLFITPNGKLYKYELESNSLQYLTRLRNWSSQFIDNDVLDWPQTWDVQNTSNPETTSTNSNSLMTLLNITDGSATENSFIKLTSVNQGEIESMYTYFDTKLNAFHMKADVPIVVGTDIYTKYTDDEAIKQFENYSLVLTENDPITNFITICKSLSWNLSDFNDNDVYHYMEVNTYTYKQRFNDSHILEFDLETTGISETTFVYNKLHIDDTKVLSDIAFNHFEVYQQGVNPTITMHIPCFVTTRRDSSALDIEDFDNAETLNDFLSLGFKSSMWEKHNNLEETGDNVDVYWVSFDITVGGINEKKVHFKINGEDVNTGGDGLTMHDSIASAAVNTNLGDTVLYLGLETVDGKTSFTDYVKFLESTERNVCVVNIPYIENAVFEFTDCKMLNNRSYIGVDVYETSENTKLKDKFIHKLNIFMDFKDEYDFEYKRHMLKDKLIKIVLHDGLLFYIKTDSYKQFDFTVSKNNKNTIDCYIDETDHIVTYLQNKNTK